jgi:hypothetical protein
MKLLGFILLAASGFVGRTLDYSAVAGLAAGMGKLQLEHKDTVGPQDTTQRIWRNKITLLIARAFSQW